MAPVSMRTGCGARAVGAESAAKDTPPHDANRRKRLLWRATHRGIREMDLILGGYVTLHVDGLTPEEMTELEAIMDFPDQEMLAWATGQAPVPADRFTPLLARILRHAP